jgi:uncharacterized protein
MNLVTAYAMALWGIIEELAWPLLLGLLVAGAIHVLLPRGFIRRQLNRPTLGSVLRAVLAGVPLCSCGVVPTAIGLRREGASKGAATGFLISTPQTGVDSVLVSASFLGWPFAVFKLLAAFVTGVLGGAIVNATDREPIREMASESDAGPRPQTWSGRFFKSLDYAVHDLLASINTYLFVGILIAGVLTVALPAGYLREVDWTQGLTGMLLALAISMPLYVCTTASVPIAASLIAAGMPPGTALVFLMAGPATNIATLGLVYRGLGRRVLVVYLAVTAVMSILFGLTFDWVLRDAGTGGHLHHHANGSWFQTATAVVLLGLMAYLFVRRAREYSGGNLTLQEASAMDKTFRVEGMTCQHCVGNVKKALEKVPGVTEATPNLTTGEVLVKGENYDRTALKTAVEAVGYRVVGL